MVRVETQLTVGFACWVPLQNVLRWGGNPGVNYAGSGDGAIVAAAALGGGCPNSLGSTVVPDRDFPDVCDCFVLLCNQIESLVLRK